ncbi:hypothetical protein [Embleya hyalina]|uniref:Peptide synthetase n=1 Tax=Embleya hyalina TaxID=516124 RepID=A0A401Z0Y2_9ACTN|nr:hypothetical protein [Embleya hyalina]GCE00492.1 peptide synthetase [Embleya hyalina]
MDDEHTLSRTGSRERTESTRAAGNIPWSVRPSGPPDIEAPRVAFAGVVARHDAPRTRFPDDGGRPVAVVAPPGPVPIEIVDPAGPSAATPARILAERVDAGFDRDAPEAPPDDEVGVRERERRIRVRAAESVPALAEVSR